METTVAIGCGRVVRSLGGVMLACVLMLTACAKGAKDPAQRTSAFSAAGAGGAPPSSCGNGTRELAEECDGADMGDASCMSLGFPSGLLNCTTGCTYDRSMCSDMVAGAAGLGG